MQKFPLWGKVLAGGFGLLAISFFSLLSFWNVSLPDLYSYGFISSSNILQFNFQEIDFSQFREKIEIYKPTLEIEKNLKKYFEFYKTKDKKIPEEVSSFSFSLFIKVNQSIYSEVDKLNICDKIIQDKDGSQFTHQFACAKKVEHFLFKKDFDSAFAAILEGFQASRTPSIRGVTYYYRNILNSVELFLDIVTDAKKIKTIENILVVFRPIALFNYKKDNITALKLQAYRFDFLILKCKVFLKEPSQDMKEKLVADLQKVIRLNLILGLLKWGFHDEHPILELEKLLRVIQNY